MFVGTQPDNAGQVDARIHLNIGWKFNNSLPLANQSQRPLCGYDAQRLIRRIELEHRSAHQVHRLTRFRQKWSFGTDSNRLPPDYGSGVHPVELPKR